MLYRYEPLGRPASIRWTIDDTQYLVAYDYDEIGRQHRVTYPEIPGAQEEPLTVESVFNEHGFLEQVRDVTTPEDPYWIAARRNPAGQLLDETYGNGVVSSYEYQDSTAGSRPRSTSPVPAMSAPWPLSATSMTPTGTNRRGGPRQGFTGHEHEDEFGLINMIGRIYDPEARRFLTPDPFIQYPLSSQSHNRYSYVWNNPSTYTDPTGFQKRGGASDDDPAPVTQPGEIIDIKGKSAEELAWEAQIQRAWERFLEHRTV